MKRRVLIADADVAVRDALKRVLEEAGYEVLTAADGHETEGRIASESVDLLLLDLDLSRQNSWNVFGLVAAQNPLLPVIIITGLKEESDAQLVPGVSAFLRKPLEVPVLLQAVKDALAEPDEARLHRIVSHLRVRKSFTCCALF